jgi:hypothetical protein
LGFARAANGWENNEIPAQKYCPPPAHAAFPI